MWHISNLWLFFECQNKSSYKNIMSAFTHGCCCCQQKVVLFFGILFFLYLCTLTVSLRYLLPVVNYFIWWPESSVQGGLQQKLTNVENIFSTSQLGRRSANSKISACCKCYRKYWLHVEQQHFTKNAVAQLPETRCWYRYNSVDVMLAMATEVSLLTS